MFDIKVKFLFKWLLGAFHFPFHGFSAVVIKPLNLQEHEFIHGGG